MDTTCFVILQAVHAHHFTERNFKSISVFKFSFTRYSDIPTPCDIYETHFLRYPCPTILCIPMPYNTVSHFEFLPKVAESISFQEFHLRLYCDLGLRSISLSPFLSPNIVFSIFYPFFLFNISLNSERSTLVQNNHDSG